MAQVRDTRGFRRALAIQARGVTERTAGGIAGRAAANLSAHRESGRARIDVKSHGRADFQVVLDDPASLSIEFGRSAFTRSDGVEVGAMEGLHVLSRAILG